MNFFFVRKLRDHWLIPVLILGVAIFVYYYGLWNAYFFTADDFFWNALIRSRNTIFEAATGIGNGVRFLNFAMIWVKTRLFFVDAAPFFWFSLLQHTVVSYLVYRFIQLVNQRRGIALLTALLFATKSSSWEVVTGTSASDYSFWAMFYVLTLTLFAAYCQRRTRWWYIGSVATYAVLTFGHDFTLSLPLVLLAYYLIMVRGERSIRSLRWSDIKLHLPFWLLWGIHVAIQFSYIFGGSSEAVYSDAAYTPGLHMILNLTYLPAGLIFPNIPIYDFISRNLGVGVHNALMYFMLGLAIIWSVFVVYLFWKGSALIRFSLALIYLPFLQYTLWTSGYAGAPRYLYLPSIGFCLLLTMFLFRLFDYLRQKNQPRSRLVVSSIVMLVLLLNFAVIQVWLRHFIAISQLRRSFTIQLDAQYQHVTADDWLYIEVPDERYLNLEESCRLVYIQPPHCVPFLTGERSLADMEQEANQKTIYWLEATNDGIIQKYPSS